MLNLLSAAADTVNPGFDVTLATVLICVICGVVAAAIIAVAVYLAYKNRNN